MKAPRITRSKKPQSIGPRVTLVAPGGGGLVERKILPRKYFDGKELGD